MINFSKKKLENKEVLLGSFFELGGQTAVEAAAIAGLDFIIIDNEHGPFDKNILTHVDSIVFAYLAKLIHSRFVEEYSCIADNDQKSQKYYIRLNNGEC